MTTKIHGWVLSFPASIASGIMRSVSHFYLMTPSRRLEYLTEKFPNLPATDINQLAFFLLAAREAGMNITAKLPHTLPIVKGVPGRVKRKVIYDTFVPLQRKENELRKGETEVVAAWIEEP